MGIAELSALIAGWGAFAHGCVSLFCFCWYATAAALGEEIPEETPSGLEMMAHSVAGFAVASWFLR